jgi:hypothetical protein
VFPERTFLEFFALGVHLLDAELVAEDDGRHRVLRAAVAAAAVMACGLDASLSARGMVNRFTRY